jgi:hypothetical protein
VPGDTDQEVDLYDAHEDGGFTYPPELACTGTGCQGVPAPTPIFATPATQTFNGEGNFETPAASKLVVKPKALTNAQKLANALKACKKQPKRKQARCEAAAHKKHAAKKRASGKQAGGRRG